jgi:adenylate cyclase
MQRLAAINSERAAQGRPRLEAGIALHRGEVMYGNVGTQGRLDMTVIGPAANEVTRLESLCKLLAIPVLLSDRFNSVATEPLDYVGEFALPGLATARSVFTLQQFRNGLATHQPTKI